MVEGVSKRFVTRRGEIEALEHVSLQVNEGEFVCLAWSPADDFFRARAIELEIFATETAPTISGAHIGKVHAADRLRRYCCPTDECRSLALSCCS